MPITSHTAAGLRFDPPWSIPEACSHDWMPCATPQPRAPIKGGRSKCQWNNKNHETNKKIIARALSLSLPWVALGRVGRSARPAARRRRRSVGYTDGCQRYLEGGNASGGALKMPRTCSWVSGLVLLLPPPPAGSPRNVFLLVTCRRRPGTQIRPPRLRRRVRAWRLPRCTIQA